MGADKRGMGKEFLSPAEALPDNPPLVQRKQAAIAQAVRHALCQQYPDSFYALCHAFAIVGSNLASIVFGTPYRPVAGSAALDAGQGSLIVMAEERAFDTPRGGAYHCWIESEACAPRQLVDLTFGHNHLYARANGYAWRGAVPPAYLWGDYHALALGGPLESLRAGFGQGRIWLQESSAGARWIERHIAQHPHAYVQLTADALGHYHQQQPLD